MAAMADPARRGAGRALVGRDRELADHATSRGARVLWARCWEAGGAPPFWPWTQLLGVLAEDLDDQALAAWLGTGAAQVAQLVPDLGERLGDAGTMLDATAKAAYKARLDELRAELEEAEDCNDPARAAKARDELDFLTAELARAVGLGGRDRRAASHAERARLNATRAIRAAMANLARANPALGRHLSVTIRTGRYCSYTPDPHAPIAWG